MNAFLLVVASLLAQPYEVTDLSRRDRLVILVFGDSGTGNAGQHRVGRAMYEVCRQRGCQLALMLGDNIYENGIRVTMRDSVDGSYREILDQFEEKFEAPYQRFENIPGFHFWAVLGNHDYRRNTLSTHITYSEFSELWRLPALHYQVPRLPDWIQIYGLHTDTDVRRDLNGLQIHSARRALCEDRSSERWKIAFGHQPIYNSGHHRDDANERRTRTLLEAPLIRACGVHLYLADHAHHQEHVTATGFEHVIQGAAGKSNGRNRSPNVSRRGPAPFLERVWVRGARIRRREPSIRLLRCVQHERKGRYGGGTRPGGHFRVLFVVRHPRRRGKAVFAVAAVSLTVSLTTEAKSRCS